MKLFEVIQEVIRLGDASQAYWDRELPRHHPRYPVILDGEQPAPPPPEDAQIAKLLENLPDNQIYVVALLTYVGRGDFTADHLGSKYEAVREMLPTRELAIAQITGQKTLADYLADALAEFQKRHIDLDSLTFPSPVGVG